MTLAAERHRRILQRIDVETSASVAALADEHGVTPMTIWRDLKRLEEQGLVKKVWGGAVKADVQDEPAFKAKMEQARMAKAVLAQYAIKAFIRPGDTLILEGGTTVAGIARALDIDDLTILTNSLWVLNHALTLPCAPATYCCGGLLREESGTFVGREALTFFTRRKADIFFMSATGFDQAGGITDPNPQEIEVKRAMANAAQRVILVADSSKAGKTSLMEVVPWRRIDAFVTNAMPDARFKEFLESIKVALHPVGLVEDP